MKEIKGIHGYIRDVIILSVILNISSTLLMTLFMGVVAWEWESILSLFKANGYILVVRILVFLSIFICLFARVNLTIVDRNLFKK